jgi:LysR family transcriptional regulator (chromosome initiation inhibitor)
VREGSFERAAAALGVTPSAVSQRVRTLEERVGGVLIVRGAGCRPTAAGRVLCAHAERVRVLEGEVTAALPALAGAGAAAVTLRVAVNADSLGTWFLRAAARFALATGALLDLVRDDEGYTAARLRSGEVLAAVTAEPRPVPGCRLAVLGVQRYVATASPAFLRQYFPQGVDRASLAAAPVLRFDQKDQMQARWARALTGVELAAPTHWIPTTQGVLEASLAGLGWGLNPLALAGPHLASGALCELVAGRPLDLRLYWQVARMGGKLLATLTREVVAAARRDLLPAPEEK